MKTPEEKKDVDYSNPREFYEAYRRNGFSDSEIDEMWKEREIMVKLYFSKPDREKREITSSTYERSQKALDKRVRDFIGME